MILPLTQFVSLLLLSFTKHSRVTAWVFSLAFSLSVSILNAGKFVESDLQDYYEWFLASKDFPILDYLFIKGNDFIFFAYNYFIYHYITQSPDTYIAITTFISYMSIFYVGYMNILEKNSERDKLFLLCICLMLPLIFVNSGHLVRQFLAAAVVVSAIYGQRENPKIIILYLIAALIHSSALLFLFFHFIRNFQVTAIRAVLISGTVVVLLYFLSLLPYHPTGIRTIDVIYSRLVIQDNAKLTVTMSAITIVLLILVFYFWIIRSHSRNLKANDNIVGYLCVFIFVFYLIPDFSELALRYMFYLWCILPIFVAKNIHFRLTNLNKYVLGGLAYGLFIAYILYSPWDYNCGLMFLFSLGIESLLCK